MNTEKIVAVKAVRCHQYDDCQCETAIYAKSDRRKGYRWYVGYGGDYVPAARADQDNMRDYTYQESELEEAQGLIGSTVHMYRGRD